MPNSSSLAIPFAGRSTADDVLSGVDLAGKTILITGCNSGIGFETMRVLQAHGAHVIALARSEQSARDAIARAGGSGTPVACDRSLNDDGAHAVAGNVLHHGREAWPLVDRVGTLHAVVAIFRDDLIPGGLRMPHDRCAATRRIVAKPRRVIDHAAIYYSITSSAVASSVGGTSRPSVFAVSRLLTSSNLVGCATGRSAGFHPEIQLA